MKRSIRGFEMRWELDDFLFDRKFMKIDGKMGREGGMRGRWEKRQK